MGAGTAWRIAMAAVLSLAGGGCAVGPDFQRPRPPAVAAYTRDAPAATVDAPGPGGTRQAFVAGARVAQRSWQAFGSAPLDELIARVFAHNPSIEAAQAALRQARENTAAQVGAYFPTLQAGYVPSRQRNATGTISPTLTSGEAIYSLHTAQLNVGYVPDVFGLNRRTVESLAAQQEAQGFLLDAAYLTLASNVAAATVQQASLRAQIGATEEALAAQRRALMLIRQQADLGAASGLDVAAQQAALAQTELTLPGLRTQLEQTRDLLAVLAGDLPAQSASTALDLDGLQLPAEVPLGVPSQLVDRRPDVRAAEAQVHAASALVGVALASRLPQFSITASAGGTATVFAQMFSDGNKFWGLAGGVTQTLFDFGSLEHRQRAAEAGLQQALAQYRATVLTAFQNVADTLYALDGDAKALRAAAAAETAARRTRDLTRGQLEAGAVNALALIAAEQAWQQARISRIQAQAARHVDTIALLQALGGGWREASDGAAQAAR